MTRQRTAYKDRKTRLESARLDRVRQDLADTVVARRTKLGLTQEGAAGAARMDVRMWQHLEAATAQNPTLLTLLDVAEALDLTLAQLLRPRPRKRQM